MFIADIPNGTLTFIGDNVFSGMPSYNWPSVTLNLVDLEAVHSSITLDGVSTAQHQGVDGTMGDGNLVATLPTAIIEAIGEKLVVSVEIAPEFTLDNSGVTVNATVEPVAVSLPGDFELYTGASLDPLVVEIGTPPGFDV